MELDSGNILHALNESGRMYPASLVKIMTAILAIENIGDLKQKITLNESIFPAIQNANATTAGFLPGEEVRAIDLLYGLMLPSGAECAIALAEHISGSEAAFIELMNDMALNLGMHDSNFTNTTGLHDKNQYTTTGDLAALFRYALLDETFYTLVTSSRHSTPPTNKHEDGITYRSTLLSKIANPELDGGKILGGKTGYNREAGQCLASLAEINGTLYILVTSGAPGDNQTQTLHIDDAFTIYNILSMN